MADHGHAIVQHSGFGYAGKPDFMHATETRQVNTASQRRRIEAAGGLVFDSYTDAEKFAERVNYPPGVQGLIPQAQGNFSKTVEVDGLAVYLPAR